MTRINAHIPPASLCDQHLVAEYREILRVVTLAIRKADKKGKDMLKEIPEEFRLGAGHVTFFYDKLKYIHERFLGLKEEIQRRGMNTSFEFDDSKLGDHPWLYNDWEMDINAKNLIVDRIYERARTMKRISFASEKVDAEKYLEILLS